MQTKQNKDNSLVWFRNDLRIRDNASLAKAIDAGGHVIAVYFFDPRQFTRNSFGFKKTERYRAKFLLETVTDLKASLAELNITLLTYINQPENIICRLVEEYQIEHVYLQGEWTSEEVEVLQNVTDSLSDKVKMVESYDQFLFHPEDIPFQIEQIPQSFTNFRKKCEKYSQVRPEPKSAERLPKSNLLEVDNELPSISDLGFEPFLTDDRTAFPFSGGERAALKRLHDYFWGTRRLSYYKQTRNGLVGADYSSKFSPWLANGSISPRTIYWEIKKYEKTVIKNQSTYWLVFELIWRDYFKFVSFKHGNDIFKLEGILHRELHWETDQQLVEQWINGTTPDDFVNANMLEIKHTGWMSNRGRQNVASYFAKNLLLDWRIGAAYFESMLLDYDVHSNYGNWMYVAGVGNDPRDRKFNTKLQAERYDPHGKFQRLWLQNVLF
ncbi:DASH family cryptochrome [Sungkyunkwania multivorans]|uniref:Cryptochrome DASH n=1 Tax=Sungkyunkwania multivorans TaxID=1173618 RepID=A0ABW3CVI2_9FLAO